MLYSIPLGAVDQKTLSSCLAQLASQRQYCPKGRKDGRTDGRKEIRLGLRLPRVLEEEEDGDDETIRGVVAVVIVTSSP